MARLHPRMILKRSFTSFSAATGNCAFKFPLTFSLSTELAEVWRVRVSQRELPVDILQRTAKAVTYDYVRATLDKNLGLVRSLLLDGVLVKERILDAVRLERALSGTLTGGNDRCDRPSFIWLPRRLGYRAGNFD